MSDDLLGVLLLVDAMVGVGVVVESRRVGVVVAVVAAVVGSVLGVEVMSALDVNAAKEA